MIVIYTKDGSNVQEASAQLSHIKTLLPLGYQQPVVQTNHRGVASFEFYTADETTSYTVIIEGLAHDGAIIWKKEKLLQKD